MITKVKTTILHIYILLQLGQVFLFMSPRITVALVYYSHTEQSIKTYNQNHRKKKPRKYRRFAWKGVLSNQKCYIAFLP